MIQKIYNILYELYGPQGWWPLSSSGGYHPNNYLLPDKKKDIFEICIGAILTQNTNWSNVEKALFNLRKRKLMNAKKILEVDDEILAMAIRPAGYFNQKAKKIKIFANFFIQLQNKNKIPTRKELLSLWGIGPETADSILLYAYKIPTFVIDSYTKRILEALHIINGDLKLSYDEIKEIFESNLPNDYILFQEYHALIVQHAKKHYSKKPFGKNCPLLPVIGNGDLSNTN